MPGTLNGWIAVKKRGRDDLQIEKDKQKAADSRKKKKGSTSKTGRNKTTQKGKTKKKGAAKPSAAARPKKTWRKRKNDEYDDDDDDSIDDFVVDDDDDEDIFEADDEDDDEDDIEHEESLSDDDEDYLLDDRTATTKKKKAQKNNGKKKQQPSKNEASDFDESDDEEDDFSVHEEDEVSDEESNESDDDDDMGTFLPQTSTRRRTKPTQALQRASVAAKTRHNPGLSLADRVAKRGLKSSVRTTSAATSRRKNSKKPAAVPPGRKRGINGIVDVEDLTSPSPEMDKKKKSEIKSHSESSEEDPPNRSKYFRASKEPPRWNAYEAIEMGHDTRKKNDDDVLDDSDGDDNKDHDDLSPVAKNSNIARKPTRRGGKNPVLEEESSDDEEEAYRDIFDDYNNNSADDKATIAKKTPKRQLRAGKFQVDDGVVDLIDTPTPAKRKSNNPKEKLSLSDSDADDVEDNARPKTLSKKKTSNRKKPASNDNAGHVITTSSNDDESMDEDMRLAMKLSQRAYTKDQMRKENEVNNLLDADEEMDEDEKVALKRALRESKKEARKKQKSTGHVNSEDEKAVEELLEDSSDGDDDDDKFDSYEEERKEASSLLNTAEQLSAEVIKHMTGWTKEKDSSSSAHKGMIVDGALSLGFLEASASNNTEGHKWISQDEMQLACPNVKLSNYQLIGVNWLALLHSMKCTIEGKRDTNVNGVLADEMGLGKTVQTICFLAWLKHRRKVAATVDVDSDDGASVIEEASWPHIIVVPVSVLPNWEREFETFCPEMNVVKYHGSMQDREEIRHSLEKYLPQTRSQNPPLDVILVPITIYQKEKSDDRKFLKKFRFDYLVVDEAHMLKNSDSLRYKTLDKVSTRHRLLLTGTPIQNSPQELLNMLSFLMPLFSRGGGSPMDDGDESVGDRMLRFFVDEKKAEESGDDQLAYKKLKQLFAPFVLRRKKDDVISQLLPPKKREVVFVKLNTDGRKVYNDILADHVNKNGKKLSAAIGDHLFTNLRKAAHHPLLLRTRHTSPTEIDHLATHFHKYGAFKGEGCTKARVQEEISKFNDFHIHLTALELIQENRHRRRDLERYMLTEEDLFSSAKFVQLNSLLPKLISEGHRILIFSVWTSCLDLLGCLMEHLGLAFSRMDGSTSSDERQELIDSFNRDDVPIFLLSTKACGLGINLTAADTCIIHDLDFNPFNDLQAEDRCHRIGQTKPVTVYKLVTEDTVDSQIYEMQERKAKMNAAIMESNNSDKKERKEILQSAVSQFLEKPKKASPSNKENQNEVVI